MTNEIEKLESAKRKAFEKYVELSDTAKEALKAYEASEMLHKEAVMYEKARKAVMRELLKTVGAKP